MALGLADYVVNETGFAADLGAEKYFDLVMPSSGLAPALAVLIASARALCAQGNGDEKAPLTLCEPTGRPSRTSTGTSRTSRSSASRCLWLSTVSDDTSDLLDRIGSFCRERGVESALVDVYSRGGEGALDLGEKAIGIMAQPPAVRPHPIYDSALGLTTTHASRLSCAAAAGAVRARRGGRGPARALRRHRRARGVGAGAERAVRARSPAPARSKAHRDRGSTTTARELYAEPARIDELWLATFAGAAPLPEAVGEPFLEDTRLAAVLPDASPPCERDEPSGAWRFERRRRSG